MFSILLDGAEMYPSLYGSPTSIMHCPESRYSVLCFIFPFFLRLCHTFYFSLSSFSLCPFFFLSLVFFFSFPVHHIHPYARLPHFQYPYVSFCFSFSFFLLLSFFFSLLMPFITFVRPFSQFVTRTIALQYITISRRVADPEGQLYGGGLCNAPKSPPWS